MAICMMKQDIDRAFNKYHAQCENGKKGGAPKGNKNASKNKKDTSTKSTSDLWTFPVDKLNDQLSFRIDEMYREAKGTNFEINDYFNLSQLAEIAACYAIGNAENVEDLGFDYPNLYALCVDVDSPSKACKELIEAAEDLFDSETVKENCYDTNKGDISFSVVFAECKSRALKILKFPHDEISKFSKKCDVVLYEDYYSKDDLLRLFTSEEIADIKALQEKNNPKTETKE